MSDASALVSAYLLSPGGACWGWAEDGSAVHWSGGPPMALRDEIDAVLERLRPGGLPPFGAVALLLAACQDSWLGDGRELLARYIEHVIPKPAPPRRERLMIQLRGLGRAPARRTDPGAAGPSSRIGRLPGSGVPESAGAAANRADPRPGDRAARKLASGPLARELLAGLDRVAGLPEKLRSSIPGKCALAEIVFEPARDRLSETATAAVLSDLQRGANPSTISSWPPESDAVVELLRDAEALREGLAGLSLERVQLRVSTGLDALPQKAPLEVPSTEQIRHLLTQLLSDRELAGLAKLSLSLMAAIHVPRAITSREELQLGGVSDLSNRGPLDRLLVSELAHDDLTLAVRIALNEALYLRREAPPRNPPERRAILIDSGIRLWGVPRLFAASVALALAAASEKLGAVSVFRASEDSVQPVDLTTRDGLVAHLEALEPAAHPGRCLEAFAREVVSDGTGDAMLVTHADTLGDPEFRQSLAALQGRALYVATVERDGSFRFVQVTARGLKPISEARLALEGLSGPAEPKLAQAPLLAPDRDPNLPLIYSVDPFPLRLPHAVRFSHARASERHGLVAVTQDGRLFHWNERGRGPKLLTARVPAGKLHGMHVDERATARILAGRSSGNRVPMLTADLASGRVTRCDLQAGEAAPRAAVFLPGAVLLIGTGRVDAFDPGSGDRIAAMDRLPPGVRWVRGRFFHSYSGWSALAFDGSSIRLEPIGRDLPGTVTLFDREGLDGPWALTHRGDILSTVDGVPVELTGAKVGPASLLAISSDGHRLVYQASIGANQWRNVLLDLETLTASDLVTDPFEAVERVSWIDSRTYSSYELRNRFRAVLIDDTGELILETRKGSTLSFLLGEDGHMRLAPAPVRPSAYSRRVAFVPVPAPAGTRFKVGVAAFRDGSRVFLDSCGLLHVKSAERALPELTLVLSAGVTAGWLSDGRVFGPDYFAGDAETVPARQGRCELDRFARRIL